MPCYDHRDHERVEYVEKIHDGMNAARLCAVFTVLQREGSLERVLRSANWDHAGVTRVNTINWWVEHQRLDQEKREREQRLRERRAREEKLKKSAISKLTDEEKKALGLK